MWYFWLLLKNCHPRDWWFSKVNPGCAKTQFLIDATKLKFSEKSYFRLLEMFRYNRTAALISACIMEESFLVTRIVKSTYPAYACSNRRPMCLHPLLLTYCHSQIFISLWDWFYLRVDSNGDRRLHNVCAASPDCIIQLHLQTRKVRFDQSSVAVHYLVTFHIVLFLKVVTPK